MDGACTFPFRFLVHVFYSFTHYFLSLITSFTMGVSFLCHLIIFPHCPFSTFEKAVSGFSRSDGTVITDAVRSRVKSPSIKSTHDNIIGKGHSL